MARLNTHDLEVFSFLEQGLSVPPNLRSRLKPLMELGLLESIGSGRGTRYFLARGFYDIAGRRGAYTRQRGLDRETNKALLLKHILETGKKGSPFSDLQMILPSQSRDQVRSLLRELRAANKINLKGKQKGARWVAARN